MSQKTTSVPAWAASNPVFEYTYKTVRMLKDEGLGQTLFAARYVVRRYRMLNDIRKAFHLTPQQRAEQTAAVFPQMPLVSVCVPLYNTDLVMLRELISSVLAQSYANFELCLADGSDDDHAAVGELARSFAAQDSRVRYKKLERNGGIAENRNQAVLMSRGEYFCLGDHDDLFTEDALFTVVKAINETGADFLYSDEATFHKKPADSRSMHFKPDFSPDYLRALNYICHLSVVRRSLADEVGLYDPAFEGSEDYDFTLRITERAKRIHHIAKPLYYWRIHAGSVADDITAKPYAYEAARRAVAAHLQRVNLPGEVVYSRAIPAMQVNYALRVHPKISILIPTKDHAATLSRCLDSILQKSTYDNYEIILIENGSTEPETFRLYESLQGNPRIRVVTYERAEGEPFNYSRLNNFGRKFAAGEQLLLLNNDIEVITRDWLEQMLMFTQREDVAACGIKLLYPNNKLQHGGIAVGVCGSAANLCPLYPREHEGYMSRLAVASNMSACTAACLMVTAADFDAVGGLDEEAFAVGFNDVDLCLKLRALDKLIVFNPVAEAYHHESVSRGSDKKGENRQRMEREKAALRARWPQYFPPGWDPFYNPNFGENSVSYDG